MEKKLFQFFKRDNKVFKRLLVFVVFLVVLCTVYTLYKIIGSALNDAQRDWWLIGSFMPRSDDSNMPPILDIIRVFGQAPRQGGQLYSSLLFSGVLFTLREALVAFVLGSLVGLGLAIVLSRSKLVEQGVMPYIIVSQTIPLIAIVPLVVIWGRNNLDFLPWEWQPWMSVSVIASYLSFFPVAVNGLKGLLSPQPEHLELMESYGASKTSILKRVRFPASLPYLFTAFKLAATASIVGVIVGEISAGTGKGSGIGFLIFKFYRTSTGSTEKLFAGVVVAALTGLFAFGVVLLVEKIVLSLRGQAIRDTI